MNQLDHVVRRHCKSVLPTAVVVVGGAVVVGTNVVFVVIPGVGVLTVVTETGPSFDDFRMWKGQES